MTPTPEAMLALAKSPTVPQPDASEKALQRSPGSALGHGIAQQERQCMIAEAAYFRAKARSFAPGGELDDWIEAELEVERALAGAEACEEAALASAALGPRLLPEILEDRDQYLVGGYSGPTRALIKCVGRSSGAEAAGANAERDLKDPVLDRDVLNLDRVPLLRGK